MNNLKAKLANIHKSWTLWFNGVAMSVITSLPLLADQMPQLQPYIPDNLYKNGMLALGVVNIMLRFKTSKSLADK
jgi:K+ transporter